MGKLTKAQISALEYIARRDGQLSAWVIGTRTAEALRSRGMVRTGDNKSHPFGGRWGYDPCLYITTEGRAALEDGRTA